MGLAAVFPAGRTESFRLALRLGLCNKLKLELLTPAGNAPPHEAGLVCPPGVENSPHSGPSDVSFS